MIDTLDSLVVGQAVVESKGTENLVTHHNLLNPFFQVLLNISNLCDQLPGSRYLDTGLAIHSKN